MYTPKPEGGIFQFYPLWDPVKKHCGFRLQKHRICVDEAQIDTKSIYTSKHVSVGNASKLLQNVTSCYFKKPIKQGCRGRLGQAKETCLVIKQGEQRR